MKAYSVRVEGRMDGLYLFASEADAGRFADAVAAAGGEAYEDSLPLNDAETTDALIAQELTP